MGLDDDSLYKAYGLHDVEDKRVINDEINDRPIVFFSLFPFMVRAFDPVIDNQTLQLRYDSQNNTFVDIQTESEWNFEGASINGELRGKELNRLPFDEGYWFEWVAFHPKTELYDSTVKS